MRNEIKDSLELLKKYSNSYVKEHKFSTEYGQAFASDNIKQSINVIKEALKDDDNNQKTLDKNCELEEKIIELKGEIEGYKKEIKFLHKKITPIPLKPRSWCPDDTRDGLQWYCPNCGIFLGCSDPFSKPDEVYDKCHKCGQVLDWNVFK